MTKLIIAHPYFCSSFVRAKCANFNPHNNFVPKPVIDNRHCRGTIVHLGKQNGNIEQIN